MTGKHTAGGEDNVELREITRVPLITNILKSSRMRWAGHVKRMDNRRYPKIRSMLVRTHRYLSSFYIANLTYPNLT